MPSDRSSSVMRWHAAGIALLAVVTVLLVTAAARHTSATVNDQVYTLANGILCLWIVGGAAAAALVAMMKRRRIVRNYCGTVALIAAVVALIPPVVTGLRIRQTKQYLTSAYETLAAKGPPFPAQLPPDLRQSSGSLISHGYWAADDQQSFEVYYHNSSDSFTLVYPEGEWQWRDNRYAGPAP